MKRSLLLTFGLFIVFGISLAAVPPLRYWILNNAGRYHIVLLHFPVGLLILAFLMEMGRFVGLKKLPHEAIQFVLGIGAVSAVLAATTGWVLQFEGGYEPDLLQWHRWLGIGTAALAVVTFLLHRFQKEKLYLASSALTTVLVTLAGHLGGSLTHGEGFLTENLSNTSPPISTQLISGKDYETAQVFPDLIHPILNAKCLSCHNANKQKGGLSLSDSTGIFTGGENGSILNPGSSGIPEMVRVLKLDLEDEMHMPPKGKAPLSQEEIELIAWWVDQGAPISNRIASVPQGESIAESIQKRFVPIHPIDQLGVPLADPTALAELRTAGYRILQLDPEKPWLAVNLSDRKELTLDQLEALDPIREQITELDLGNTSLSEDHLDWVNDSPHLLQLKLDNAQFGVEAFAELSDLEYLEVLNVYSTDLKALADAPSDAFPSLQKLYAWGANIPAEVLQDWQAALPALSVVTTSQDDIFPVQDMMAPEFSTSSPIFLDQLSIGLACQYPDVAIHYTLDGSTPDQQSLLYQDSLILEKTTNIRARAFLEDWNPSPIVEQTYLKILPAASYRLAKAPAEKYAGVHPQSLIDLKVGEATFNDEAWIGFWGRNCSINLDLAGSDSIRGIAIHALEDVNSWVLFPRKIRVKGGNSRQNLQLLGEQSFDLTQETLTGKRALLRVPFPPTLARYFQIEVIHFGKLPVWHQSAGQDAWMFIDEVAAYQ